MISPGNSPMRYCRRPAGVENSLYNHLSEKEAIEDACAKLKYDFVDGRGIAIDQERLDWPMMRRILFIGHLRK